jgi:hypothetical protein
VQRCCRRRNLLIALTKVGIPANPRRAGRAALHILQVKFGQIQQN